MLEIEQEIIDRLKQEVGLLSDDPPGKFRVICSHYSIAAFEDEEALTPYIMTFPPSITLKKSSCRDKLFMEQEWPIGVGIRALPDHDRTVTSITIAEDPIMDAIKALLGWKPASAKGVLELIDIAPPIMSGTVAEYRITFRTQKEEQL
jgi:hypothetical protein